MCSLISHYSYIYMEKVLFTYICIYIMQLKEDFNVRMRRLIYFSDRTCWGSVNHTRTSSSILQSQLSRSRHFTTILPLHLLHSMIQLGFKVSIEKKRFIWVWVSLSLSHPSPSSLAPCNTTSQKNKTIKGGEVVRKIWSTWWSSVHTHSLSLSHFSSFI